MIVRSCGASVRARAGVRAADLLYFVLELGDAVHVGQFLQHCAAAGKGGWGARPEGVDGEGWEMSSAGWREERCSAGRGLNCGTSFYRQPAIPTPATDIPDLIHYLQQRTLSMGNDGGSIPDRRDLVRNKKKVFRIPLHREHC